GRLLPGSWLPGARPMTVCNLFANVYAGPKVQAPLLLTLPLGSPVPLRDVVNDEWRLVELPEGRTGFVQAGDLCAGQDAWAWQTRAELERSLVATAQGLLGLPYRWGGTTPWGIDCSGLVQLVYRLHGLVLPRDASDQARDPRTFPVARADLAPGDLLFFANHGHVGLAISTDRFLHATTHLRPVVQVSEVDDPHWTARRDEIRRVRLG
ncbi:MAG: C40 family peptidase, partial [Chitinophagales bacterium]